MEEEIIYRTVRLELRLKAKLKGNTLRGERGKHNTESKTSVATGGPFVAHLMSS